MDCAESPPSGARLPVADLLRLADAIPLLDRLALLVTVRNGGDRQAIVFGILDGLQDELDAAAPADGRETVDVIHAWFALRIAEEEGRAADRCGHGRRDRS